MANAPNFLGTGADDMALALKVYSGHFVEAFRNNSKLFRSTLPVINRQDVEFGKEFQFLQFADIPDAEEFDPGNEEMAGQDYAVHEGTITADKVLLAHKWIGYDKMAKAHFSILERLAKAHSRVIGMGYDRRIFTLACSAARATAVSKNGLTVHNGGNRVTRTGGSIAAAYPRSTTGAANFRADLRQLGRIMDEDNIPPDMRYLWIPPYINEVVLYDNTNQVFSKDFITEGEGNNIQRREIMVLEGFKIVDRVNYTSNGGSLPDQNIVTGPTKYRGNFTAQAADGIPAAIALCGGPSGEAAVGMATFHDIRHIVQWYPEKLAWLVASYVLAGAGQQDPWCAASIEAIT